MFWLKEIPVVVAGVPAMKDKPMAGIIQRMFKLNDGVRRDAEEHSTAAVEKVEAAKDRLSQTIAELLDRNDHLTGRQHVQKPRTQ